MMGYQVPEVFRPSSPHFGRRMYRPAMFSLQFRPEGTRNGHSAPVR